MDLGTTFWALTNTHGFELIHRGATRELYRNGVRDIVRNDDTWQAIREVGRGSKTGGVVVWVSPTFADPLTALAYAELNEWSST